MSDASTPLVEAVDIVKQYGARRRGPFAKAPSAPPALNGVSVEVQRGETLAIIGESGSGKSTLGRIMLRLTDTTSGRVVFDGRDLLAMKESDVRRMRSRMNYIFQNPYGAVNRRHTIERILAAPLEVHNLYRGNRRSRCVELLDMVSLLPTHLDRFPHELSGGQLQRVVIARALATNPDFVVADEPTTGLDVITSARLVTLLDDLKRQLGLSMMFISHDLRTVAQLADRIVVMRKGGTVEHGACNDLLLNPQHPYTQKLIDSVPKLPEKTYEVVSGGA
ncbi:ATP-binding cassette domain-containing protein [Nocardioides sp. W7]|uniref:ABC transporter ATP-binding protein n=1 Tax=Nocardioides sp. W7 TaxID=2931390 RepID=UPI001FCFDB02|nr:ATP-binding cassette domain-containing protein [Nocardioides sp. W7]